MQLPGAEGSRFRIMERPGSLVGSVTAIRSPFYIESIKLSHVLVLDGPSTLNLMGAADSAALAAAVASQQTASVDYLKGKRRGPVTAPSSAATAADGSGESKNGASNADDGSVTWSHRTSAYTEGGGQGDARIGLQPKVRLPRATRVATAARDTVRQVLELTLDGEEGEALVARVQTVSRQLGAIGETTRDAFNALREVQAKLHSRRLEAGTPAGNGTPLAPASTPVEAFSVSSPEVSFTTPSPAPSPPAHMDVLVESISSEEDTGAACGGPPAPSRLYASSSARAFDGVVPAPAALNPPMRRKGRRSRLFLRTPPSSKAIEGLTMIVPE